MQKAPIQKVVPPQERKDESDKAPSKPVSSRESPSKQQRYVSEDKYAAKKPLQNDNSLMNFLGDILNEHNE